MSDGPAFEEYLMSKKIDSHRFREAEPDLWQAWKNDFEKMHANSFTVQKLNLINPIRRKYQLPLAPDEKKSPDTGPGAGLPQPAIRPGRPLMRPKGDQDQKSS